MENKRGVPKKIETPEKMLDLFIKYVQHVKSNPIKVMDFVGKDGKKVYREKERPLSMVGFELFCVEHSDINYPDLTNYFENRGKGYDDFVPIVTRIRAAIRDDQISGGMAGIYNSSLTARLNGLTEKIQQTNIEQPFFGKDENN